MKLKRELDNSTIIGDCIISPTAIDKTRPKTKTKQKQNQQNTKDLNKSVNHFDLIGICSTLQPKMTEYIFFKGT